MSKKIWGESQGYLRNGRIAVCRGARAVRSLLITGSGSKLTDPLLRRLRCGFESITLLSKESESPLAADGVSHIKFDLSSSYEIPVLADMVVHLAAIVPYNKRAGDKGDVLRANILCFLSVMRYAASFGVQRVVLVSSTDVYPLDTDHIIDLTTAPAPHNNYGLSKLACERVGRVLAEMHSVQLSILRVGPLYSEREPAANKISGMLSSLRKHQPIVLSEPSSVLSLLHVESAAEAIVASLSAPPGTYLVAGQPIPLGEFFALAKCAYNSSSDVSIALEAKRPVKMVFDLSESKASLGWTPFQREEMFMLPLPIEEGKGDA